jgi:saccharopine dehydrogenase-like NADP-dependent oxidoreductase
MKVLLLGVGMQGRAALHDLAAAAQVDEIIAADIDIDRLRADVAQHEWGARVRCEQLDAADAKSLARLFALGPEIAVDLLPVGFIGPVACAAIEHGVHLVNTFYVRPEIRALADQAAAAGVTILPEFGVDPGIDLVLLGEAARSLDAVEEIHSYGAGIPAPEAAGNPLHYKVSWNLRGVLEAYRRPARVIRAGRSVEIDPAAIFAPENVHTVEMPGLGKLEAYPNGDAVPYAAALGLEAAGLRAAGRYTMRWPGHCAFWRQLAELHLLDREPVDVDGRLVDRVGFLAAALEPHLQYAAGERDVVALRVDLIGRRGDRPLRVRLELIDRLDQESGLSAMSRTVGFTASIGALMIADRRISGPGLRSPLADVPYGPFIEELARRGIRVTREETPLESPPR